MEKLLTCVLAIGCVGTSAMLVQRDMGARQGPSANAQLAADGAFRDGLYLGRLARTAVNLGRNPLTVFPWLAAPEGQVRAWRDRARR